MEDEDLSKRGSVAYVKLSKSDDKLCQAVLKAATMLGHGDFPHGIHMTLLTEYGEADLTRDGVGLYEWSCPFADPDCQLVYEFDFAYHNFTWIQAETLTLSGVRLHVRDLFRVGLGKEPKGLVCTTFVSLLLGLGIAEAMPLDTLRVIVEHYKGGILWVRNQEDSESWAAMNIQTFWTGT